MDICLVNMPYAPIQIPSIALGLLQSILKREGLAVSSLYANIRFADTIGVMHYSRRLLLSSARGFAEWTFSHLAFPEKHTTPEEFLNVLEERESWFLNLPHPRQRLLKAQEAATAFLDDLVDNILALKPSIVGCTSNFSQHVPSLALLRKIRHHRPGIVTMMGGANCESIMGQTTHKLFPWVDYVVSGEADDLIAGLCRNILARGKEVEPGDLPPGVFAPSHRVAGYPTPSSPNGGAVPQAVINNLNHQLIPDYDDYLKTLDATPEVKVRIKPGLLVEASRGCWWKQHEGCTFCGLNGGGVKYRAKPAAAILTELQALQDRYGINRFEMVDNVFNLPLLKTLAPKLIELGSPYDIFFEIRVGMNRHQVEEMRRAGVIWVQPGIESLHTKALRLMNKGAESWQNIQLLKWLSQFGIRCLWFLLYDLPGEDDQWYEEMASYLPLLTHLQPPQCVLRVRFVRFSTYHCHPEEYGLKLTPSKLFSQVYPNDPEELANLLYFFDEEEQLRDMYGPALFYLLLRSGLAKVKRVQQDWWEEHATSLPPYLMMKLAAEGLLIQDSRPIAEKQEFLLRGLEMDLYLAGDEAPSEAELYDDFCRSGYNPQEIQETLLKLIGMKIMLPLDGRYISLALKHPVEPLRPLEDFPGGCLVEG